MIRNSITVIGRENDGNEFYKFDHTHCNLIFSLPLPIVVCYPLSCMGGKWRYEGETQKDSGSKAKKIPNVNSERVKYVARN